MSETSQDPDTNADDSTHDVDDISASSYYGSTDDSLNASPSNPLQNLSDTVSRKRRNEVLCSTTNQSRRKRLKPYYNDSYRELFNETVIDAVDGETGSGDEDLKQSQIGITSWSASEKSLFFDNLARKGRDEILEIAKAIGTKSEPEVRAYLLLLDEVSTKQQIYSPNESLPGQIEIPAASEISLACASALENAADALAFLQQKDDEKAEKQKHGRQWQLTAKYIKKASRSLRRDPENATPGAELVTEANLLNLKNFLALTQLFFMNSSDPDYHWQTHAVDGKERPSIFYTAFSDFNNLVLSVTQRLVRAAIFFAISRLRAMDGSRIKANRQVRRNDVIAAINVLGMKKDRHEYWVGLARRCKLNVYKMDDAEQELKRKLNHDMVEQELDRPRGKRGYYINKSSETSSRAPSLSSHATSSISSDSTPEFPSFASELSTPSEAPLNQRSPEAINAQDQRDREEDAYISALDQQASLREEKRLWDMLGETTPNPIEPDEINIPKKPRNKPIPLEDIGDWRRWIHYSPEWEVVGQSKPDWSRQRPSSHFHHSKAARRAPSGTRRKGKERITEPIAGDSVEDESVGFDTETLDSAMDEDPDNSSDGSASSKSSRAIKKSSVQEYDYEGNMGSADSTDTTNTDHLEDSDEPSAQSAEERDSEDSLDRD
ncbi:MAG: hypothetical protein Q9191_003732 [Dirinaria sp. TL-2023a]